MYGLFAQIDAEFQKVSARADQLEQQNIELRCKLLDNGFQPLEDRAHKLERENAELRGELRKTQQMMAANLARLTDENAKLKSQNNSLLASKQRETFSKLQRQSDEQYLIRKFLDDRAILVLNSQERMPFKEVLKMLRDFHRARARYAPFEVTDAKLREEIEHYLGLAVHVVQVNANETDVYVLGLQKYTDV